LVIQIKDIVIFHGKMIRILLVILLSSIYTGQRTVEAADNTGTGDVKFDPGFIYF
jgi:hypothetical protein